MYGRKLKLAASALLIGAAVGVQAQPFDWQRGPASFAAMDLDGDELISAQEFAEHRDARRAARAAQGRLLRNAGQAPRFESWDADGDGLLSRAELRTGQQARFAERRASGRPCWRCR